MKQADPAAGGVPRPSALHRRWAAIEWPLVAALGVLAIWLGYVGFTPQATPEARTVLDRFYLSLQLFAFQSGAVSGAVSWQLQIARFLAPAVALYTAVQAAGVIFRDQLEGARILRLRDHVIVCGLGRQGRLLARDLARAGERVIAIEKQAGADTIQAARHAGVLLLQGDATAPEVLSKARVDKARLLVAVCGGDGVNVDIAANAEALRAGAKGPQMLCAVHLVDPALCDLLKEHEIVGVTSAVRMQYFNVYQLGAFVLMKRHAPFDLARPAASPHVLIVGLGNLGERLLLQMASAWAARPDAPPGRFRVTIVDREGLARVDTLRRRHPGLAQTCELHALPMDTESPEFERGSFLLSPEGVPDVTAVYVCLDDEAAASSAALRLNRFLSARAVPIVVRLAENRGLARLIHRTTDTPYAYGNLRAFGLLDAACSVEIAATGTREILARANHESYLSEQRRQGIDPSTNPSMVPWADLSPPKKESNRRQADHIGTKLAAVGRRLSPRTDWTSKPAAFSDDEIERLAIMEHDRWVEEKRQDGWTCGPARDERKKQSPYLVPWEQLSEEVREIDRAAVRSLPAFLAQVGFEISEPAVNDARVAV